MNEKVNQKTSLELKTNDDGQNISRQSGKFIPQTEFFLSQTQKVGITSNYSVSYLQIKLAFFFYSGKKTKIFKEKKFLEEINF